MNKNQIKNALDNIAKHDPDLKHALKIYGYPKPRVQPAGFETFVITIANQQLSTKAASTIMQRVRDTLGEVTPTNVLAKRKSTLRKAGLSERKVDYIKGLAKAIKKGHFDPDNLDVLNDEDAINAITDLHGFGEWSAEIYLMFSLGRKDIFPANDLALQAALQNLKQLEQRPTPKVARSIVEHWAPWRSAGSLFLWHYYSLEKN
ncbi:MAG: DNA-3-methyladenine glycosylase 2 family protein [Gammaproteobacteria bacterium]|nr:DNA-3-methyladenine glycosylase 2 family protein [Gammaproteobacteria bacterium]